MCVAAVIKGASPSLDDLLDMEEENPHGAGLAWQNPGEHVVTYAKGLDARAVHALMDALPRPVLLHFRWATHGSRSKALTHPFPLGIRALLDDALEGKTRACLIHNGVWSQYEKYVPDFVKDMKLDISDTAVAAFVALRKPHILRQVAWATALGRASHKGMQVSVTGDWKEREGNSFSNLRWVDARRYPASRKAYTDFYDSWGDSSEYGGYTGGAVTKSARSSAKVFSEYRTPQGSCWRKDAGTGTWYKVAPDVEERAPKALAAPYASDDDEATPDFYMVPGEEVMAPRHKGTSRAHDRNQPRLDLATGEWSDDDEDDYQGGGYSG